MAHNKRSFNIQIFITKNILLKIRDVAVNVFAKIYSKRSSAHDRYIYTRVYLRKYTTHTLAEQLTFNVRIEWIFSPRVVCLLCKRAQCMCRAQHVSSTHTHTQANGLKTTFASTLIGRWAQEKVNGFDVLRRRVNSRLKTNNIRYGKASSRGSPRVLCAVCCCCWMRQL